MAEVGWDYTLRVDVQTSIRVFPAGTPVVVTELHPDKPRFVTVRLKDWSATPPFAVQVSDLTPKSIVDKIGTLDGDDT